MKKRGWRKPKQEEDSMTAMVELTQADGHTESLAVPRALLPDLQLAAALFQTERGRRCFSIGVQLFSGWVARLERLPWDGIADRDLVAYLYDQTRESDSSEAIREFFAPSLDAWIDLKVAFPGQEATINTLALMAYLTRAMRRKELTSERLPHEIALVIPWLLSYEELSRRLLRHPMGGILFLLALTSQEDYQRFEVAQRAMEWVSTASRPKVIDREWAKIALGERDPDTLEEEIRSVVGARLAKEMDRLRSAPPMDVVLKAIGGELNFHKDAAVQVVIDEDRRRKKYRKDESLEDPDLLPADPTDPDPSEEALAKLAHGFANREYIADRLSKGYRLSPKQETVMRYIVLSKTEKLSNRQIADGARVDRSTVETTLEKLKADPSILRQILFP